MLVQTNCRIGFLTNALVVVIICRIRPGELTIASPIRWSDPSLHLIIAGMSMAAVDNSRWETYNIDLIQELCGAQLPLDANPVVDINNVPVAE